MTPTCPLCGPCARSWCKWLKGMMARKWGGQYFYEHAIRVSTLTYEKKDG